MPDRPVFYTARAERLYGGGWRISIQGAGCDIDFFRRTDWPHLFQPDLALEELREHGWEIDPEDRYGARQETFGWTALPTLYETWSARLLKAGSTADRGSTWQHVKVQQMLGYLREV